VDQRLADYRKIWDSKPVLREVYHDYYKRILQACNSGLTLEIGGGSGNIKERIPNVISLDVLHASWLDVIADAQKLPFKPNAFQNLILFDVLHHIENQNLFFKEASRILKPGGKIIMLEPGITPLSWFFYNFLHQEPVILNIDPLAHNSIDPERDPYDSNQAIPTLMFGKYQNAFFNTFPEFKIIQKEWLSLFAYPLSGGFKKWSLIPPKTVLPLLKFEEVLLPYIGKFAGFRLFVTIEKNS
jgi:SAM-dependent methyltransferase